MPRQFLLNHLTMGALLMVGGLSLAGRLPAADPTGGPGYLGISLDEVDEAVSYHLDLKDDLGVMVTRIQPDSPANRMGLKVFDVIVKFDGRPVYTPRALREAIADHKSGDSIEITVRRGSSTEVLAGKLGIRPKELEEERFRPGFPGLRAPEEAPQSGQDEPQSGRSRGPDGRVQEWHVEPAPPLSKDAP
jgi:hypothetical protein